MSDKIKYIYFSNKKKKYNWCNNDYKFSNQIENLWNNVDSYMKYSKDNYNGKDWNKDSLILMSYAVSSKFFLNQELRQSLVSIPDNSILVNKNNDKLLGGGKKGNNYLGKMLTVLSYILKYGNCENIPIRIKLYTQIFIENKEKFENINFKDSEILGQPGKEGTTYLVNIDGKEYAVKTFRKNKSINKLKKEAEFQRMGALVGVSPKVYYVSTKNKYIVMDKLDTRLKDYLENNNYEVVPDHINKRLDEIFNKLDEIRVLHNDGNILNFMLDKNEKVYIIDYGFAKKISANMLKKTGSPNLNYTKKSFERYLKHVISTISRSKSKSISRTYKMNNKVAIIFMKESCPYSQEALKLLQDNKQFKIEKHIIREDNDTNHKKMLKKLSNLGNSTRTFPQIWINDQYIGGCDNLKLIIKND